jgi:hypothetical protein
MSMTNGNISSNGMHNGNGSTNGSVLHASIKEAVPSPMKGFVMDYVEAVKSLNLRVACDPRVITAAHKIYPVMADMPVIIEDYLCIIKKFENEPRMVELLTSEKAVSFMKDNLAGVMDFASDGRNMPFRETAVFLGFMLGMAKSMSDDGAKSDLNVMARKEQSNQQN